MSALIVCVIFMIGICHLALCAIFIAEPLGCMLCYADVLFYACV